MPRTAASLKKEPSTRTDSNKENVLKSVKRRNSSSVSGSVSPAGPSTRAKREPLSPAPSPQEKLEKNFTKQFEMAQNSGSNFKKLKQCAATLQSLEKDLGEEKFLALLMAHVNHIFKEPSCPATTRLLKFVALAVVPFKAKTESNLGDQGDNRFDSDADEEGDLREPGIKTIGFCTRLVASSVKQNRVLACELLYHILKQCEDNEIASDEFDSIVDIMSPRALDKNPQVRIHVLKILACLIPTQEDDEDEPVGWLSEDDSICDTFMFAIGSDTSAEVRKSALELITATPITVPVIVRRCHDTKESVRVASYQVLGRQTAIEDLSRKERIEVIKAGLNDRVEAVRKACVDMLIGWLAHKENCCLSFLEYFRVEINEDLACKSLHNIFKKSKVIFKMNELEVDDLTPTSALYWRALCRFCISDQKEREDELLPNISELCDLVKKYMERSHESTGKGKKSVSFIIKQLLLIASMLDFSDEVGRSRLSSDVREMLCNEETPESLMEALALCMESVHPESDDRSLLLFGLMSEISTDFKSNGDETNRKCLEIASLFLARFPVIDVKDGDVSEFLNSLVLLGIQSSNPKNRLLAVQCLGLCALSDLETSLQHLPLFLSILENDLPELRLVALQILFDLLLNFGGEALNQSTKDCDIFDEGNSDDSDDSESDDTVTFIIRLVDCLDEQNEQLQATAVEGMSKLLFNGRLSSSNVLGELLTIYYDPQSESNTKIRQCLSVFFPAFAFSSSKHQQLVADAFMPTFVNILNASQRSSLSKVKPIEVAQYMIHLSAPSNLMDHVQLDENQQSPHDDLALLVVRYIFKYARDSAATLLKLYCRVLSSLELKSKVHMKLIKYLIDSLEINDKTTNAYLEKLSKSLATALNEDDLQIDEGETIERTRRLSITLDKAMCKWLAKTLDEELLEQIEIQERCEKANEED